MARLYANPVKGKFNSIPVVEEEEINLVTSQVNGGINTYIDPADISDSQMVTAKNARVTGDVISPRDGTSSAPFSPQGAAPNNKPILNLSVFHRFDGSSEMVVFDEEKIFKKEPSSWTEITGAGFTVETRQRTLAINDRFFFTTGRDPIQEINLGANTYAALGNAPPYKFLCGFFNRVVGANLYDGTNPNPIRIGRSGDLNFGEWNPLVDISAGYDALVEGEGDFSDEITGLFGFASLMLIPRQRSLWLASKVAVAEQPFQYVAAFPNIGFDSPDSIAQSRNGITGYDYRSNQVYHFEIGDQPRPIATSIRKDLKKAITDNSLIQGSYDPVKNRYYLCIPTANSDTTIVYAYDYETNSWTYDERYKIYGVFPVDAITLGLVIDDLVGTIDSLIGHIDDLSNTSTVPSSVIYGHTNGILTQDDPTISTDDGRAFTSELCSKIFQLSKDNISVSRLMIKFIPRQEGSFSAYFSRNGGATFELYKTVSFGASDIGKRKIIDFPKHITTSEYQWKITSTQGKFDLNEYRIEGVTSITTRRK